MKKVLEIYKLDWRRIAGSKAAIFLIAALIIIPSLYAWFNIRALWDPYGNTGGIKIAVANDDSGTTINGQVIKVGDEIVEKLKGNKELGWTFLSKEAADRGVVYGDYYASLYLPEDFSKNLASILSDHPEQAEIIFTVNDKINAITPKITNTGATTITNQVSEQFINTVSKALLGEFDQIGITLSEDLPTIRKLENKLFSLRDALPKINEFGQQAIELEKDLPNIQEKVNKIISLPDYLPMIEKAGDTVIKVNEAMPAIEQAGEKLVILKNTIPQIQDSAEKLNQINDNFTDVQDTIADAIKQAEAASDVIEAIQEQIPQIEQLSEKGVHHAEVINQFLNQLDSSASAIASALKLNVTLVNETSSNIVSLLKPYVGKEEGEDKALAQLKKLLSQQTVLLNLQTDYLGTLLAQGGPSSSLEELLGDTRKTQNDVEKLAGLTESGSLQQIYNASLDLQQETERLSAGYDNTYKDAVQTLLQSMQNNLATSVGVLNDLKSKLPEVSSIMASTKGIIDHAIVTLKKYEAEMPQLEEKVQVANQAVQSNMDEVINGIEKGALFYSEKFPSIQEKMGQASEFAKNDLPTLEGKIKTASQMIEEKMPSLENAIRTASDLAESELPQLTKSIEKVTDKLNETKKSINLEDVADLLRRDVKSESDFLASPVKLTKIEKFPISNYGSASSPFYTCLAIWVGVLLLISMLSVDVEMPAEIYKPHHLYYGRGLTFLTIALAQTTIIVLGNIFLIDVNIHDKGSFFIFSLLICFVFTVIVYTLVSIFGNIGKGIVIFLLVLQIAGSGGNFPIEVSSVFFRDVNPFLPFTHAINLLREGLGGVVWQNAFRYMVILLFISLLFILMGTLLKKPLMKYVSAFTANAKKSKIFH